MPFLGFNIFFIFLAFKCFAVKIKDDLYENKLTLTFVFIFIQHSAGILEILSHEAWLEAEKGN